MGLTESQQRAIALGPKFSGGLSMICSIFLIHEVYCDYQRRKISPIKRILVGMSAIDIMSSFAWFLSTWAVPRGTFAFSTGNQATCNFQGFLLQLAVGAPMYNSSLALFYLLVIKYRWTEEKLRQVEYWVHAFILIFAVSTATMLLPLDQYNHVDAICWVTGDPIQCGTSILRQGDTPCERGSHAWLYALFLFYLPLWICVVACGAAMVSIYLTMRQTLQRAHRYDFNGQQTQILSRSDEQAKKLAVQAFLYTLTFVIAWFPATLASVAKWFNWRSFWFDFFAVVCEPLQGFWNFFIFARYRSETMAKIRRVLILFFPFVEFKLDDFSNSGMMQFAASGRNRNESLTSNQMRSSNILPVVEQHAEHVSELNSNYPL